MQRRSESEYITLFESLLDDEEVISSDVDVMDASSEDVQKIDYDAYEYEWRIYFTNQIPDYAEFIKKMIPRLHEKLSILVSNTKMFTSVSQVRIFSHEADQLKYHYGFGDVPVMRDYVDQIDQDKQQWPYYAWTAVFCSNMLSVRNIRKFLTFIGLLKDIADKEMPVSP